MYAIGLSTSVTPFRDRWHADRSVPFVPNVDCVLTSVLASLRAEAARAVSGFELTTSVDETVEATDGAAKHSARPRGSKSDGADGPETERTKGSSSESH